MHSCVRVIECVHIYTETAEQGRGAAALRQENASLNGKGAKDVEVDARAMTDELRRSESEFDLKDNEIPEASMSQLLGIMQSISKLSKAVSDGNDAKKL